jgi:hypothetical protein
VIMTERDIAPTVAAEVRELQLACFAPRQSCRIGESPLRLHRAATGYCIERRFAGRIFGARCRRVWNRENRKVAIAEMNALRLVHHDVDSKPLEKAKDADRSRSFAACRDCRRSSRSSSREAFPPVGELAVSVDDRRFVGRTL